MLINSELKYKANINLKKSYWVCVAVCLIFSILTGVLDELPTVDNLSLIHNDGTVFETLLTVSSFSAMPNNVISYSQELVMNISDLIRIGVQTSTFLIFIFVFIFVFLLRLFILYPLNVGTKRFFMAQREDKIRFKNIFYVYQIGKTENTVKTMFFVDLYTTLWYFLFIIPGVIKSYEYMMIPYILS